MAYNLKKRVVRNKTYLYSFVTKSVSLYAGQSGWHRRSCSRSLTLHRVLWARFWLHPASMPSYGFKITVTR